MPDEGQNLREHIMEKYGTSADESANARARMTEVGAELGFAFDYADDMRMVNTFPRTPAYPLGGRLRPAARHEDEPPRGFLLTPRGRQ